MRLKIAGAAVLLATGAVVAASPAQAAPTESAQSIAGPTTMSMHQDRGHHRYGGMATSVPAAQRRRSVGAPSLKVGLSPSGIGINHRTGTVYVADATGLSLFNGRTCNSAVVTGCRRIATARAGSYNIGIAVDEATNTVYVASNGDNAVSIVDGARCNAHTTAGCRDRPARVLVGTAPSHLALDRAHHTPYVTNEGADSPGHTLSMVDTARCNARATIGCVRRPRTARVGQGPDGVAVDPSAHTVYVSNGVDSTVSVLDTAVCNAGRSDGCGRPAYSFALGASPVGSAVDSPHHTLYIPGRVDGRPLGTLSVIDTSACNAGHHRGCRHRPVTARVGSAPIDVAYNPLTRRVYVVNQEDSDVSVVDGSRCNATRIGGCDQPAPTMGIGFEGGAVAVDPATDTVYASAQTEGTVTVLAGAACYSGHTTGCRHPAPTTPTGLGPAALDVNHRTGTLYVPDQEANTVSVVDAAACNAAHLVGCRRHWPTIAVGEFPRSVAVDEPTNTVYTANYVGNSVSVIDGSSCDAGTAAGCGQSPATVAVPGGPITVVIDPATRTLYVASVDAGTVSVIDLRTCNARVHKGCGRTPAIVHVGSEPAGILVDRSVRTVYVTNRVDNTVSLIDETTCNSRTTSSCSTTPRTVRVGALPRFMAVDHATSTLYISNHDDSTLSMLDIRSCNAHVRWGCRSTLPTVPVGYYPYGVVVDQATHVVYVGNVGDSTVSHFNGARCNARVRTGCSRPAPAVQTGGWPTNLLIDKSHSTLYVSQNVDATVSVLRLVGSVK